MAGTFDVQGARSAGYSDADIVGFLAKSENGKFDFQGAVKAGYTPTEILDHMGGGPAKGAEDTSLLSGLKEGVADAIRGYGDTAKYIAGSKDTGAKADELASKVAPKNYKPSRLINPDASWLNPLDKINFSQIPRRVAEMAPGVATDLAVAGSVGMVPGIGPALALPAGVASFALRNLGSESKKDAVIRTGDENAEPELQDKLRAGATVGAQALLDRVALGRLMPGAGKTTGSVTDAAKSLAKTTGIEGGVGGAQDVVGQVGSTVATPGGVRYDPNQTADAALGNAALGTAAKTPRAVADARAAIKFRDFNGDNKDASAAFANRVKEQAQDGNLGNVKDAFDAVNEATKGVRREITATARDLEVNLSPDALNALAKAKRGVDLTPGETSTLSKELKSDPLGPQLESLVRQASVSAKLRELGDYGRGQFAGGAANFLSSKLRLLRNPVGYGVAAGLPALGISTGSAAAALPYALPAVAGIGGLYAGARALDKLTGARSPAQQFVNRFAAPRVALRPDAVPQPPVPTTTASGVPLPPSLNPPTAKITRKSVNQAPKEEPAKPMAYEDVPTPYAGMNDKDVSSQELAKKLATDGVRPGSEKNYMASIEKARASRRGVLATLAAEFEPHAEVFSSLLEQLHHRRSVASRQEALTEYAKRLPPEIGARLLAAFQNRPL